MRSRAGIGGAILLCLAATGAAAQGSPDEPFAVTSRGRPAPHSEREVVVLRDSLPARPAATRADSVRATAARPDSTRAGAARADSTRPVAARPDSVRSAPRAGSTTPAAGSAPAARTGAARTGSTTPPPAAPTTRATASNRTHRIEWGDTWYAIAQEYGVSSAALQAANPDVDPNRLVSGEVLRIPTGRATARRSHRVEPGESLWAIARRYGVSAEEIRKANGLEGDRVRIGETLVIPGGE
jgi:membrane-bound lytic murein transglycosylase D